MIVYHGTSAAGADGVRRTKPEKRRRKYTPAPCFCTTSCPLVAQMFATRKTSIEDFQRGLVTGVVLEFELAGEQGKDFGPARDPSCMQDEKEVAVYNVNRLRLVAVWRHGKTWTREPVQ